MDTNPIRSNRVDLNSCQFVFSSGFLENQHAIAIAVEAIAFTDRFLVRAEQKFAPRKRTYQHQQSRTRKVKIRQQKINYSELIRWVNKEIGRALSRWNFPVGAAC